MHQSVVLALLLAESLLVGSTLPSRYVYPSLVVTGEAAHQVAEWTIAASPEYSVSAGDDPSFQLHRVSSGVLLDDGRALIANAGSVNLVLLSPAGAPLKVVGRSGEGPGEFGRISHVFMSADTLAVWDSQLRRISFFTSRGDFVRMMSLIDAPDEAPIGTLFGTTVLTARSTASRPLAPGERRTFALRRSAGEEQRLLTGPLELPTRILRYVGQNNGRTVNVGLTLPDGCWPEIHQALVDSEIFVVEPRLGVLTAISPSGTREVFRAGRRLSVTDAMRAAIRESLAETPFPPPPRQRGSRARSH